MALDPADRRPIYIQIAAALRGEIEAGRYGPGDRIPSARALQETYKVSQESALHALRVLIDQGLIETRPSLGAVVRQQPKVIQRSAAYITAEDGKPLATWRTAMAEAGLVGEQEILGVARVVAPEDVAERLRLDEREMVVVRRRVMLVNRWPYQLVDSYYPASIAGGTMLERDAKIVGGSVAALTALGYEPVHHLEELTFHPATPDEQRALQISHVIWVVRLLRTSYAADDVPVEVVDMALAADRHRLLYEVPAKR
jgi:GntR family transcriptional regulator